LKVIISQASERLVERTKLADDALGAMRLRQSNRQDR